MRDFDFKFWRAAVVGAVERPRLFVLSSNGRAAELRFGAVQEAMAVRAEPAEVRAERADLRVKCSELASQLDAVRAERAELASHLEAMRAELADLRAEGADLRVKCSALARHLDAMEKSTSWRITAPLRHIRRFASRFSAR